MASSFAPVAHLDRVSVSEAEGSGFESRRARQKRKVDCNYESAFFTPKFKQPLLRIQKNSGLNALHYILFFYMFIKKWHMNIEFTHAIFHVRSLADG